ncbi:MAG: actin-related 2 3 complex subunit 1-like [Trebouxia sp. A1-2]|nr:MAG: actin-related 2 3 complex subunit 1-like [Trebouxia sp. A1-2]
MLLATASSDSKCRVFSTALPGSQLCFTSHGSQLHVVSGIHARELLRSHPLVQDQSVDPNAPLQCHLQPQPDRQDIQLRQLPFKVVAFLQEDLLIAGGFEGDMYMVKCDVQQSHAAHLKKQLSAEFSKKLDMFKQQTASPVTNKVTRSSTQPQVAGGHHKSAHISCIIDLHVFQTQRKMVSSRFSTAGLDGQVVVWDIGDCMD